MRFVSLRRLSFLSFFFRAFYFLFIYLTKAFHFIVLVKQRSSHRRGKMSKVKTISWHETRVSRFPTTLPCFLYFFLQPCFELWLMELEWEISLHCFSNSQGKRSLRLLSKLPAFKQINSAKVLLEDWLYVPGRNF